jgi:hypothetical protein
LSSKNDAGFFDGVVHSYCENQECVAREMQVRIKGYDDEFPKEGQFHCPVCGEPLLRIDYITTEEQDAHDEREAIGLVNSMLYEREQRAAGETDSAISASVLILEELPEQWKSQQ